MARVTIIIPNYNGKQLLENCIRTLERQTCRDFHLLIVDNGSTDGSGAVTSETLDIEWIFLKKNTGFCGAVNVGIARTKTPYFLLLNNDTEAEEHFVAEMLAGIEKSERIFSCSAQMLDYRDRELIDNAGDYYTVFGWALARGKGRMAARYGQEAEVFSACGGAAIYRTEAVGRIGRFDERHFAYLEDVDMGYRARIYGYRNRYLPDAKVYHVGSATTGARYNEKKVFLAARNSVYLAYKNMPPVQLLFNLPFLAAGVGIKALFFLRKGFAGEYLRGIRCGIVGAGRCERVHFRRCNLPHYVRIQLELWVNCVKVLLKR